MSAFIAVLLSFSQLTAQTVISSSGNVSGAALGVNDVSATLKDTEGRKIISAAAYGYGGKTGKVVNDAMSVTQNIHRSFPQYLSYSLTLYGKIEKTDGGPLLQMFKDNPCVLEGNAEALTLLETLLKSTPEEKEIERSKDLERLFHIFLSLNKASQIDDSTKIKLLIQAIPCKSRTIRQQALIVLTERTASAAINQHIPALYQALKLSAFFAALKCKGNIRPEYADALPLIGRLSNLTKDEKILIADSEMIEPEIRAKLGNKIIEEKLISAFVREKDYHAKCILARQLGYIGSDKTIKALLKQLDSPVKLSWKYGEISIRGKIIQALHLAMPQESLFSVDVNQFAKNQWSHSPEKDQQCKDYARKVNSWTEEHFGFTAWKPENVWFSINYNVPMITE